MYLYSGPDDNHSFVFSLKNVYILFCYNVFFEFFKKINKYSYDVSFVNVNNVISLFEWFSWTALAAGDMSLKHIYLT